jgi:hypothetical protein
MPAPAISAMIPRGQAAPPTRVINTARVREYIAMRRILQALVAVALAVFVVDSGCSSNREQPRRRRLQRDLPDRALTSACRQGPMGA